MSNFERRLLCSFLGVANLEGYQEITSSSSQYQHCRYNYCKEPASLFLELKDLMYAIFSATCTFRKSGKDTSWAFQDFWGGVDFIYTELPYDLCCNCGKAKLNDDLLIASDVKPFVQLWPDLAKSDSQEHHLCNVVHYVLWYWHWQKIRQTSTRAMAPAVRVLKE